MRLNGTFLGGFQQGMDTAIKRDQTQQTIDQDKKESNQRLSIAQRAQRLQEANSGREAQNDLILRADKSVTQLVQTIKEVAENARAAGKTPEEIGKAVAPLKKGVADAYSVTGRDPTATLSQIDALVGMAPTPKEPLTDIGKLGADQSAGLVPKEVYDAEVNRLTTPKQEKPYSDIGKLRADFAAGNMTDEEFIAAKAKLLGDNKQVDYKAATELGKLEADYRNKLMSKEDFDTQREAILAKSEKNSTSKADSKFAEEISKKLGAEFVERRKIAVAASNSLQNLEDGYRLVKSNMISGFGAEYKIAAGKALQEMGVKYFDDAIANAEAYMAARGKETANLIKAFGSGTAVSNVDLKFANMISGGEISLSKESMEKILELNKKWARTAIQGFNQEVKKIDPNILPFDVSLPEPAASDDPANPLNLIRRK